MARSPKLHTVLGTTTLSAGSAVLIGRGVWASNDDSRSFWSGGSFGVLALGLVLLVVGAIWVALGARAEEGREKQTESISFRQKGGASSTNYQANQLTVYNDENQRGRRE